MLLPYFPSYLRHIGTFRLINWLAPGTRISSAGQSEAAITSFAVTFKLLLGKVAGLGRISKVALKSYCPLTFNYPISCTFISLQCNRIGLLIFVFLTCNCVIKSKPQPSYFNEDFSTVISERGLTSVLLFLGKKILNQKGMLGEKGQLPFKK